MSKIEIEFRSILSKEKFLLLEETLKLIAEFLGDDDKDVTFFLLEGKLLKVSKNISQKNAKISLKLNEIGKGNSFEEIEIPIRDDDTYNAVRIFKQLGFTKIQNSHQSRRNYLFKGVTIALKYSDSWKYHVEFEIVINDLSDKSKAENIISSVARELEVDLMSDSEIVEFTSKYNNEYIYESKTTS